MAAALLCVEALLALLGMHLVRLRRRVTRAFEAIERVLGERHDLIPKLAAALAGIPGPEREALERALALTRRAAAGTLSPDRQVAIEGELTRALAELSAALASRTDLASAPSLRRFRRALAEVEQRHAATRRRYNRAVTRYNRALHAFPANVAAWALRLQPARPFDASRER